MVLKMILGCVCNLQFSLSTKHIDKKLMKRPKTIKNELKDHQYFHLF